MTIDPKDFKTLIVRVVLVTIVLRAAPMFTADLAPGEAAAVLGLTGSGEAGEPWLQAVRAWALTTGGVAGLVRLPALLAEVALPVLALGYARVAGWGSLAGLVVGLTLALSPLAMQAGHRIGGGGAVAALVLLVLTLLRTGLRGGERRPLLMSALGLVILGLLASPALVVVPAGLWLVWRAVADTQTKQLALRLWTAAPPLALALRWAWLGYLVPEPDGATAQFALGQAAEPSGWHLLGPLAAAGQGLALASPLGPMAEIAHLFDLLATPTWLLAGALLLLAAALYGTLRGLVQPDPPVAIAAPALRPLAVQSGAADATDDEDLQAEGAAAADGWQTLGVTRTSQPRTLGDRDWGPPLILALAAGLFVAQACARGVADGVQEAIAAARVGIALPIGAGLAALATPRSALNRQGDVRVRRRSYWTLGFVALALFGLGSWHLLEQTRSVERLSSRKVARFAKDSVNDAEIVGSELGSVLAVGPRGWAVAAQLDPYGNGPRLRLCGAEAGDAVANTLELLKNRPGGVVVTGDKAALGTQADAPKELLAVMRSIDRTLRMHGLEEVSDSHRLLGQTAVIVYSRSGGSSGGAAIIRPQIVPGVAP